jgi:hypothetical protein
VIKFSYFTRHVYGVVRNYPASEDAHKFARLMGVKTFRDDQIRDIVGIIGIKGVEIVGDPSVALAERLPMTTAEWQEELARNLNNRSDRVPGGCSNA